MFSGLVRLRVSDENVSAMLDDQLVINVSKAVDHVLTANPTNLVSAWPQTAPARIIVLDPCILAEADMLFCSGLQLTSTRRASTGDGAFHTLTLRKPSLPTRAVTIDHPPSPPRPLTNDTGLLASRWTHMLEIDLHEDAPISDFAQILRTVRDRIGRDAVLDAAAKYTADSHHAFMARSESALSIAKRSGMEAMRALRFALARHSTDATDEMMLSMYIMTLSEVSSTSKIWSAFIANEDAQYMGGIEEQNQRFHIVALCQILKTRMRAGRWSVFEQRLLRSISREEVSKWTEI